MKTFQVTSRAAQFGPGTVLVLDEAQVRRRRHRLRAVDGGHEPIGMIEFKHGEIVRVARGMENLRKADFADITPVEAEAALPAEKPSKRKAAG